MGVLAVTALLGWSLALSIIDVRRRRLPNVLTLTGAVVILAIAFGCGRGLPALAGAVTLALVYLLVHLASPAGLGAGDVKLAVALGGLTGSLGVEVWVLAALGAPVLTAVSGVVSLVRGRGGTVPHGPAMLLASLCAAALPSL